MLLTIFKERGKAMYDKMTIKCCDDRIIKHLTPKFFRNTPCAKIVGVNDYKFLLYNLMNTTSSNLAITCAHINSAEKNVYFQIENSLRKWWFGDKSIEDFSKEDYEAAINRLFDILEIPQTERKYFIISEIEVGMNINTKRPCAEILNRIVGYRSNCYSRDAYKTGIAYKAKTKGIKFYDKVEEISKKLKNKRIKSIEEKQFLKNTMGKNVLRIELSAIYGKSKIKKTLGFDNLEDSIIHFDNLYQRFFEHLQHICYDNIDDDMLSADFTNMTTQEFGEWIWRYAMDKLGKERVDRIVKPQKRSVKRKVKWLYANPLLIECTYNKNAFLKDIKIQMLYSMQKSRCLHLVKKVFLKKSAT